MRLILIDNRHGPRGVPHKPCGKGLVGITLRYPYEVRNADDYFDDVPDEKVTKDMLHRFSKKGQADHQPRMPGSMDGVAFSKLARTEFPAIICRK